MNVAKIILTNVNPAKLSCWVYNLAGPAMILLLMITYSYSPFNIVPNFDHLRNRCKYFVLVYLFTKALLLACYTLRSRSDVEKATNNSPRLTTEYRTHLIEQSLEGVGSGSAIWLLLLTEFFWMGSRDLQQQFRATRSLEDPVVPHGHVYLFFSLSGVGKTSTISLVVSVRGIITTCVHGDVQGVWGQKAREPVLQLSIKGSKPNLWSAAGQRRR